jgi:hypothetical protein
MSIRGIKEREADEKLLIANLKARMPELEAAFARVNNDNSRERVSCTVNGHVSQSHSRLHMSDRVVKRFVEEGTSIGLDERHFGRCPRSQTLYCFKNQRGKCMGPHVDAKWWRAIAHEIVPLCNSPNFRQIELPAIAMRKRMPGGTCEIYDPQDEDTGVFVARAFAQAVADRIVEAIG